MIQKRTTRDVPVHPGGTLSDYVPFYFTPCSPMLLNIKTGYNGLQVTPMPEIAILVTSLHRLEDNGVPFVFTDRHAYLQTANFSNELNDLKWVPWKLLQNRDFKRDPNKPDKFERYQAEALVHRHVPIEALTGIACYGVTQQKRLQRIAEECEVDVRVDMRPTWYF